MFNRRKKSIVTVKDFRKACLVINSCQTYEQLKNAMRYVDLFYSQYNDYPTYSGLQRVIGNKIILLLSEKKY